MNEPNLSHGFSVSLEEEGISFGFNGSVEDTFEGGVAITMKALVAGLEFANPPEDDANTLVVFLTNNLRGVVDKVRAARNANAEEAVLVS